MQIGEVIRTYRKRKYITQEEMAKRLGVTAPAVNKWENGHSQPDIMLLVPISRLLNITLDTLLSFQEKLTTEEINSVIAEMDSKLKTEPFEDVFQWAKEKNEQYPNCEQLIWQIALLLDSGRLTKEILNSTIYEEYIYDCYIRVLESEDENIRNQAADSLFNLYVRKEQYEKAEEYLRYFSNQNPERKIKQAFIYTKTNRLQEGYKAYEELLISSYQTLHMIFQSMYILAMEEKNKEKAYLFVDKQEELAKLFEMGTYYEVSCKLDLVTVEKDVEATMEIMEQMLACYDSLFSFATSTLYEHMEFEKIDESFIKELYENILTCFRDEETYGYMKKNKRWQKVIHDTVSL